MKKESGDSQATILMLASNQLLLAQPRVDFPLFVPVSNICRAGQTDSTSATSFIRENGARSVSARSFTRPGHPVNINLMTSPGRRGHIGAGENHGGQRTLKLRRSVSFVKLHRRCIAAREKSP